MYVKSATVNNPKAHVNPSRVEQAKAILACTFPLLEEDIFELFLFAMDFITIIRTTKLTRRIKATGRRTAK